MSKLMHAAVIVSCILVSCDGQNAFVSSYPPLMGTNPSRQIVYEEHDTTTMGATTTGNPLPSCMWYRDGDEFVPAETENRVTLSTNPGDCSLTFNDPLIEYQGFWKLLARSDLGTAVSDTTLFLPAALEPFSKETRAVISLTAGNGRRLICGFPKSFPPAVIVWEHKKAGQSNWNPIDYNARLAVDPDGGLNFAHLETTDSGRYQCTAHNNNLRKGTTSSPWEISVTGNAASTTIAPEILWKTPNNIQFFRGENATLKCVFKGKPTPIVIWNKVGGLSSRAQVRSYGLEIFFPTVEYDDAGVYECSAHNSAASTPKRETVTVNVVGLVRWTIMPESKTAGIGETVQFICQAEGTPEVFPPKWFINGLEINKQQSKPDNYVFSDEYGPGTVLTVTDLQLSDTATLQCNITNEAVVGSWVHTNFYINVQSEQPSIIEFSEGPHKWAAKRNYQLICRVFGAPTPIIAWLKDGQSLTGGRFITHANGTLTVEDVSITDEGTYTCSASNEVNGQSFVESRSTDVTVRRPTLIQQAPEDLTVTAGTQAKFICTALTDADESKNLVITWLKDGESILSASENTKVFLNTQDNSLQIASPDAQDSGLYTCVASNGVDVDTASATLRVQDRPAQPVSVSIFKCQNTKATVQWSPGVNNNAPMSNFILQYKTNKNPSVWYTAIDDIPKKETQVDWDLNPDNIYSFRVLGQNKIGISDPSLEAPEVCGRTAAAPLANPRGARTLDKGQNLLYITWQAMSPVDFGGDGFTYLVSWRKRGATSCDGQTFCEDKQPHKEGTIGRPGELHLIDYKTEYEENVGIYEEYEYYVTCKNVQGACPAPPMLYGFSGEGTPNELVSDFGLRMKDGVAMVYSDNATFEWTAVDESNQAIQGFFRGYMIRYKKVLAADEDELFDERNIFIVLRDVNMEGPGYTVEERRLETNDYEAMEVDGKVWVTLPHLPPDSNLQFSIAVINKRHYGVLTTPIAVRTLEGAPGPVDQLAVAEYGPTHVKLQWLRPIEPNGVLTRYQVGYKKITGLQLGPLEYPDDQFVVDDDEVTIITAKVTGLKPLQMYRFYIWAHTACCQGSENFLDDMTVAAGYPDAPKIFVQRNSDSSLRVSWEPANTGTPANVFYVQYKQESAIDLWQRTGWEVTTDYIVIPNSSFVEGWRYDVRVVASNGGIYETASKSVQIYPSDYSRTTAEARDVFSSAWFIGLLIVLIFFTIVIVLLFMTQQNKGGIYTGQVAAAEEIEPLRPYNPDYDEKSRSAYAAGDDGAASERIAPSHYSERYAPSVAPSQVPSERYVGTPTGAPPGALPAERRHRPEPDDFMQDDAAGYGEKASFIGQYVQQKELPNYRRTQPIPERSEPFRPEPTRPQPRTRSIPSEATYTGVPSPTTPAGDKYAEQRPPPRRSGTGAGNDYRPRNAQPVAPQPRHRGASAVQLDEADNTQTDV